MFHQPPPGETLAEKTEREIREAEEKRISDRIDDEIKLDKTALKKQKNIVKVLLLGQSESGMVLVVLQIYKSNEIQHAQENRPP